MQCGKFTCASLYVIMQLYATPISSLKILIWPQPDLPWAYYASNSLRLTGYMFAGLRNAIIWCILTRINILYNLSGPESPSKNSTNVMEGINLQSQLCSRAVLAHNVTGLTYSQVI